MDRHMAAALDRWLTTDPRDSQCECPCGDGCEMVEVDCHEGTMPECETVWILDSNGDRDVRVCRREADSSHHERLGDWW